VCAGDCGGTGTVSVDEIILGVRIALGEMPMSDCLPMDSDHDGVVTVSDLVAAINSALSGCE
jgi:hypothetical protein